MMLYQSCGRMCALVVSETTAAQIPIAGAQWRVFEVYYTLDRGILTKLKSNTWNIGCSVFMN
jgi:isopentenyl diphosphate isomerase/L-lactate dehydrogenase-like FMN-dependent dehydrogenase